MKQKIVLLFLLMLSGVSIQAQVRAGGKPAKIVHLNEYLESLGNSGSKGSERARLEHLMNDLQPSVYLTGGSISVTDPKPVNLYTDVRSLSRVSSVNAGDAATIEFVTIKASSPNELSGLNLAPLSTLPQLRYVYILLEAELPSPSLFQYVEVPGLGYQVFYNSMLIN